MHISTKLRAIIFIVLTGSLFVVVMLLLQYNTTETLEISTSGSSPFAEFPIINELTPQISIAYKKPIPEQALVSTAEKLFTLHLILDGKILDQAVAVEYRQFDKRLYLIPPNGLGKGTKFAIKRKRLFRDSTVIFHTPQYLPTQEPLPELVQWYPSGNSVPANTLIFYALLSAPVAVDTSIVTAFDIYDQEGASILDDERRSVTFTDSPFHRNAVYRTLIPIMLHPGRIKRGVLQRELYGLVMNPNNSYSLAIDHTKLRDSYFRMAKQIPIKTYRILEEDRQLPRFMGSLSQAPSFNTKEPVLIVFSEAMDYDSVRQGIHIYEGRYDSSAGQENQTAIRIARVQHDTHDGRWLFYPSAEWKSLEYTVEITEAVKDLAHNSLHIPFETATVEERNNPYSEFWYFTPLEYKNQ